MIEIVLLLFPSVPGSLKEASEPLSKGKYCCSQAYRKHQVINPASFELTSTEYFEIHQNPWNRNFTGTTPKTWSYNSITAKTSCGWNPHTQGKRASYEILLRDNELLELAVGKHFFSKQNHCYTDSLIAFSGHIVLHSHLPLHIRHSHQHTCY